MAQLIAAADTVSDQRKHIDDIDEQIAHLIETRREYSQEIQRLKASAGLAAVDITRENEVLNNYAAHLGKEGRNIAHRILHYSKS